MKILFAADTHPYSAHALEVLSQLAENTWADVTILGVVAVRPGAESMNDDPLVQSLNQYREKFLKHWPDNACPYAPEQLRAQWLELEKGLWQHLLVSTGGRKELAVRVRVGDPDLELVAATRSEKSDLVVLGCTGGDQCLWADNPQVPQKLVDGAECSILLVKEAQPVKTVYACFDESNVSQESLDMINQVANAYNAQLQIVGLTKGGGINAQVYSWLDVVYYYYKKKGLQVNQRLVEIDAFETFINQEVSEGLLALWLGKKSVLNRFFKKKSVGRFVQSSRSSVLVLR